MQKDKICPDIRFYFFNSRNVNANKNPALIESHIIATTDSDGNIYTEFKSSEYVIVAQWAIDVCVSLILTGDYTYAFHCSSYSAQNIGSGLQKTIYFRYYKRG